MIVAAAGVLLLTASSEAPVNVSGTWLMRETDPSFERTLRLTWLEISQDGELVTMRAWEDGDTWTCTGRGQVEGRRLRLKWWGKDKYWRGTADLELSGGELRGTFQRLDVHAGVQYCRGKAVSR